MSRRRRTESAEEKKSAAPRASGHALLAFAAALLLGGCASPPSGEARVQGALRERVQLEPREHQPLAEAPSEDALVAAALRNNAAFRGALADLGIAEAEWLRAGGLPPLTFSLLFPLGPKQIEYAAKFPVDVLWLRPKRVAAAKRDWEAMAETVVQHGLDLVRDVRIACADVAAARGRAEYEGDDESAYAEYAERRYRAGALPAQDAAAARARAAAAGDRIANNKAALLAADARLAELSQLDVFGTSACHAAHFEAPAALPSVEALLADALAARPDLRAAELALEAAGERAGLARREIFQLVAVFDANGSGSAFEAGPGVEVPIPLDGGRAARALADAKLAKASAAYQATVQRVTREVREALAHAEAAAQSARAWRSERLPALAKWQRRSEAAYANGASDLGARLEVAITAQQGQRDAADAFAAWRRARAELERALGHRLELANAAPAEIPPTTAEPTTGTP